MSSSLQGRYNGTNFFNTMFKVSDSVFATFVTKVLPTMVVFWNRKSIPIDFSYHLLPLHSELSVWASLERFGYVFAKGSNWKGRVVAIRYIDVIF
jgi:hypothetical protein